MTKAIHALIVGAGRGSRFGASVPKQYTMIVGRTVLEHSVARLCHDDIDDLTLVIAKDDATAKALSFDFDKPIGFAIGGAERFLSVKSGVEAIVAGGASDDDWVLIHDGARPCLPKADLTAIIYYMRLLDKKGDMNTAGVILATPVADTLKFAKDGQICQTIDRQNMYQAQTPQAFRLGKLRQMLLDIDGKVISDEASGFELLGQSVHVVDGSRQNIKLTYPEDLPMIEVMLSSLF